MEMPKNYFITCFEKLPEGRYLNTGSSRCFGYYETFEDADDAVRNNCCDLHECLYCYCFIEAIEPGIHAICELQDRFLYKYNFDTQLWDRIEEPECLHRIVNFSIG